jgi:hypothetical protein
MRSCHSFEVDLRKGKAPSDRQEIGRVVYEAMIAIGVGVPAGARFQVVSEHDAGSFLFDAGYLGSDRRDHTSRGGSTWSRDDWASRV